MPTADQEALTETLNQNPFLYLSASLAQPQNVKNPYRHKIHIDLSCGGIANILFLRIPSEELGGYSVQHKLIVLVEVLH